MQVYTLKCAAWLCVLPALWVLSSGLKSACTCAQAVNTYQQLATLLRGEQPKGLLLPAPRGYVASRVRTLAGGAVVHEFQWAGGGQWAGKPWSAELPTDTALLLFLFSAFLAVTSCFRRSASQTLIERAALPSGSDVWHLMSSAGTYNGLHGARQMLIL